MELHPPPLWNLAVGDVAHQDVLEGVLGVIRDRRRRVRLDEVAPLELREALAWILRLLSFACAEIRDRSCPEHGSDHGGVVGKLLLGAGKPVEPGADQALDGRGHRQVAHLVGRPPRAVEQVTLAQHPHCLFEEERIAAGVGNERGCQRRLRQTWVADQAR